MAAKMSPREVLSAYWERGQLPIDPKLIARKAGIEIGYFPFEETASGSYDPVGASNNGPLIQVNSFENEKRIRFTMAHELGHHFLGHGAAMRDTAENFRAMVRDPKEVEANRFAARLLMPGEYVKALVIKKGITSLTELARLFDVSTAAMEIRLKTLAYI